MKSRKPIHVANPVRVEIGGKNKGTGRPKTRKPVQIPQSRLHIPQTRKLSAEIMWEEQCDLPKNQRWGTALISPVPTEPGTKYEHFVMVFLSTHKTEKKALVARDKATEMYTPVAAIFELGQWHALPVPTWLSSEKESIEYTKNAIIDHMKYEKKKTEVRQAVMQRRQKQTHTAPVLEPEVETKHVENPMYDEPHDEQKAAEPQQKAVEPPDENFKRAVPKKQSFGLAFVLPEIQSPNQKFNTICFNWLGSFSSEKKVEQHQKYMQAKYPEWHINVFEMGTKVELPLRSWLMDTSQILYTQDVMKELMHQPEETGYIEPEEVEKMLDRAELVPPNPDVVESVNALLGIDTVEDQKAREVTIGVQEGKKFTATLFRRE